MAKKNIGVFGICSGRETVEGCIEQLREAGFRNTDVSVLVPENPGSKDLGHEKHSKAPEGATAGAGSGALVGGTLGWLAGMGSLAIPGLVLPLIAAGPLLGLLAGMGAGGALGGLVGALVGLGVPEYEAKRYEGRIRKGGILVSVHCDSNDWARKARSVLEAAGAEDISSVSEARADYGRSDKPRARTKESAVGAAQKASRSLRVRDIMTSPVETIHEGARLGEASDTMRRLKVGFLPVRSGESVVGVVTDRDLAMQADPDESAESMTVHDVMTAGVVYCSQDQVLRDAAELMEKERVRRLLVVDGDEEIVGVLTVEDIAARGDPKLAGKILERTATAS